MRMPGWRRLLPMIACSSLLPAAMAAAPADPLPPALAAALQGAEADTAEGWAYTHSIKVYKDDVLEESSTLRIDPSRPAAQRCMVLASVDAKGVHDQAKEGKACSGTHELPTYARLAEMLRQGKVTPIAGNADEFGVQPKSGKGLDLGGASLQVSSDDLEHLAGKAHLATIAGGARYVDRLKLWLGADAGNLLARLNQLDLDYRYAQAASGPARLPTSFDIKLKLTLIGLWMLDIRVEQRFTDFHKVVAGP